MKKPRLACAAAGESRVRLNQPEHYHHDIDLYTISSARANSKSISRTLYLPRQCPILDPYLADSLALGTTP